MLQLKLLYFFSFGFIKYLGAYLLLNREFFFGVSAIEVPLMTIISYRSDGVFSLVECFKI